MNIVLAQNQVAQVGFGNKDNFGMQLKDQVGDIDDISK